MRESKTRDQSIGSNLTNLDERKHSDQDQDSCIIVNEASHVVLSILQESWFMVVVCSVRSQSCFQGLQMVKSQRYSSLQCPRSSIPNQFFPDMFLNITENSSWCVSGCWVTWLCMKQQVFLSLCMSHKTSEQAVSKQNWLFCPLCRLWW
jgi:hypothetical protein